MKLPPRLLVLDGNSLLFRAFYATYFGDPSKIMRTKDGRPTNALFAFANMLAKLLSSMNEGDSIFLAFDADAKTFRKEEFEDYKANRKPAPEELILQFDPARDLVKALGIPYLEMHGFEADDLAGTAAKMAEQKGYKVEVYTSDKDYLQLVSPWITVNLLKKGLSDMVEVTPESMVELFGFPPKSIIDFKGLRGDPSDNLPGIPGVGDKRATDLLKEYGDFDSIIDAAKNGKIKGKLGENLIAGEKMGRLCYELATMKTDVELPFTVEDFVYLGYSRKEVNDFAMLFELRQFPTRLPKRFERGEGFQRNRPLPELVRIESIKGLDLGNEIGLAFDLDETSYHDAPLLGIGIANKKERYYLRIEEAKKDAKLLALLKDPNIKKCVYDGKKILVGAKRYGIEIQGIDFDLMLAGYLLDSDAGSNPRDLLSIFGETVPEENEPEGYELIIGDEGDKTAALAYHALRLKEEALRQLKAQGQDKLYQEVELPLSFVLADMEIEGFPLDANLLSEIGEGFRKKKEALELELSSLAGHPFNPSSPKQVASLLYDELKLKGPRSRSTSVDILESLAAEHEIPAKILEYRKYAKLVGTYIDGLLPHCKEDGKIHTSFNQALTSTGRLSSSNPNLQNISTRDIESKEIKKAFHYPNSEYQILSLDYAQIELRLLASLSGCKAYQEIFASGRDLHSETARKIFDLPMDQEVPSLLRRRAKAINFAIVYGTTAFGLADQIGASPKEASGIIASFYRAYPEIQSYLERMTEEGTEKGYVSTMLGRRRNLPDLKDPNYMKREAAKRMAMNAPVQGSAADLIKVAMIKVDRFLKEGHYQSKMVLQIHDELLFKLSKDEEEVLLPKLKEIMDTALPLDVPLSVEGSVGDSWFNAKD